MKEQIIQLEPHDDVISVRDKLGWLRTERALLVFPNGQRENVLQRRLDLLLVQRELTRRGASFALITRDPLIIDNARELGISTFDSIDESRLENWRTRKARISVSRADQPRPFDPTLGDVASRLRPDTGHKSGVLGRWQSTVVFGLGVAAILVTAYVTLPSATVIVAPAGNQVNVTIPITADPQLEAIDFDVAAIPARIVGIEVDERTTIETSGSVDTPTFRASGVVTFVNQVPEEVIIPAGTAVRTTAANPIRFVTTASVTLSGTVNAAVDAPVEAVEAGVQGNLPGGLINAVEGPLASRVRVTNPSATRGGDIAQMAAVSQDDYDRLRAGLLQQLQQRAYAEMSGQISETEFVVTESLLVVLVRDETFDRFLGEQAETVSLQMRVVVQGVIVDERLARQVAINDLANKVGPTFNIGDESLIFRRGDVTQVDNERRVTFVMQGGGDVTPSISGERVQQITRGKTLARAADAIESEYPLRAAPQFEVRPVFLGRMPLLLFRIEVEVITPA